MTFASVAQDAGERRRLPWTSARRGVRAVSGAQVLRLAVLTLLVAACIGVIAARTGHAAERGTIHLPQAPPR